MTRTFSLRQTFLKCAVIFAAHFVFATGTHAAEVAFSTEDGAISVAGRFVAFDGEAVTVAAQGGLVTFRAEGMACAGEGCPDLLDYVPEIRIAVEGRAGDVLLPALLEVYARDQNLSFARTGSRYSIGQGEAGGFVIDMRSGTAPAGVDAYVSSEAQILITGREMGEADLGRARARGLGRPDSVRQARILALDALVPISSPALELQEISIDELIAMLAGENEAITVHLPQAPSGELLGFLDRYMVATGRSEMVAGVTHDETADLVEAVSQAENGISLVPFGETGNAQPIALTGSCNLRSTAGYLSIKSEDYPLTFPIYLYLPQYDLHPSLIAFVDWLRSPAAQLVIRRAGFVDLAAVAIPFERQGERLGSAILNAGAEVPLEELQRMVRAMQVRTRMSSTFRFEPGSTRLDGQSRSNVMQLAQSIRDGRFRDRELVFVGFSDGRGPAAANRDLSFARAQAVQEDVRAALGGDLPETVTLGVDGFGEALPMACDDSIWGQQTNRRVELWVRERP